MATKKDEMIEAFKKVCKNLNITIVELVDFIRNELNANLLKAAWKYEEKECDKYNFKELLEWINENIDKNRHNGAIVTKEHQLGYIILKCCMIDGNREPFLNIGDPYLFVKTKTICDDLKNNFGDKDMIIIE